MSKLGKNANDIFGKTANTPEKVDKKPAQLEQAEIVHKEPAQPKAARGRPVMHQDTWSKCTVVLLDAQIHWLDSLSSTIRLKTRASVSRAELLRGMIAACEASGIDLTQTTSEEDVKNILLGKLKG